MAGLKLFGSIHYNRRKVVARDLREFADDADAFALENSQLGDTYRDVLRSILLAPVPFVGAQLAAILLYTPLCVLFNRDLLATEQLAARRVADDRPIHVVDRHPAAILADRGPVWAVGNWTVLLALAAVTPVSTLVAIGLSALALVVVTVRHEFGLRLLSVAGALVVTALGWAGLVVGALGFTVLVVTVVGFFGATFGTIDRRNEIMLADVSALAEEHGYDEVCLTTGYAHSPGLVVLAPSTDLTVTDVFEQRWLRSGRRLEMDGDELVDPNEDADVEYRPVMESAGSVLGRRAVATVVDWFVLAVLVFASWLGVTAVGAMTGLLLIVCLVATPPVYYVACETKWGQTVGKRLVGICVVRLDGSPPTRRDAIVRTIYRPIDFLPLGFVVGTVVARWSMYGQRMGDKSAATTVVRVEPVVDGEESSAEESPEASATGRPEA